MKINRPVLLVYSVSIGEVILAHPSLACLWWFWTCWHVLLWYYLALDD